MREQDELFKTVLMYINNERKSTLIQLLDSGGARSVADLVEEFREEYPDADPRGITDPLVHSILRDSLSPLKLATKEETFGNNGSFVKGIRLTEEGEQVKRYAGFALEQFAREFNQSIYPILGMMNSTSDRTRPYETTSLLYTILEKGPISITELISTDVTFYYNTRVRPILNNLLNFQDVEGNPIPLVDISNYGLGNGGKKAYQWVKNSNLPSTKHPTQRWSNLISGLSSDPERVWTTEGLAEEFDYDNKQTLSPILRRLVSKGNLVVAHLQDLQKVSISFYGGTLIYGVFEPIRGDIAGDQSSSQQIDNIQLSPHSVATVLNSYVNIKDEERLFTPSPQKNKVA
jgi:hypothetical protein